MNSGLAAFIAGLTVFWAVLYALYGGRRGRVEVHPGYVIARAGLSLEPMREGRRAKAWRLFGWASLILLAASAALFYYYTFTVFLLKYVSPPPCSEGVAGFVPFIPGVTFSLEATLYILVALGIAVLVHEVAHAFVARAVGLRVKDAGLALFLFIPGAFVEPDEEELNRAPSRKRLLVYSAGVGANVLLALVALLAATAMVSGAVIAGVEPGSPAAQAGLEPGMRILSINGSRVASVGDAVSILESLGVQDPERSLTILFEVEKGGVPETVTVYRPGATPSSPCERGRIGVTLENSYWPNATLGVVASLTYLISLSLAMINAAPLVLPFPGGSLFADGAYVLKEALGKIMSEGKATVATIAVGTGTLLLMLSLMSLQTIM